MQISEENEEYANADAACENHDHFRCDYVDCALNDFDFVWDFCCDCGSCSCFCFLTGFYFSFCFWIGFCFLFCFCFDFCFCFYCVRAMMVFQTNHNLLQSD